MTSRTASLMLECISPGDLALNHEEKLLQRRRPVFVLALPQIPSCSLMLQCAPGMIGVTLLTKKAPKQMCSAL